MAAPVISSVTTDKSTYNKGDLVTLTVVYSDADNSSNTYNGSVQATDSTGNTVSGSFSFTVTNTDQVGLQVTDTGSHVWTKTSDANGTATFTTTA